MAAKVHDSGLTIREYLWTNFTMVDPQTGNPIQPATPAPSATPTSSPSPSAIPSPAATTSASVVPGGGTGGAGTWFGVDPPFVLAGLLLVVLASVGFAAWRGVLRG